MAEPFVDTAALHFGLDDAESDGARGLLGRGFTMTLAYATALSGRKTLFIGRKGAGKSAICFQLSDRQGNGHCAKIVTPDQAAGTEIRQFELIGLNEPTAKSLVWRYVLLATIARHLVDHAAHDHRGKFGQLPVSVRRLRRFLGDNDELNDDRSYDRITRAIRGLQTSLSLEVFGVKASMDMKGGSPGARASKQLETIETGLLAAFAETGCATKCPPLLLLVDQIEQIWSADVASDAMVIGLLMAGKRVSSTFGGAARCLVFLRADIYDTLPFDDADKFHGEEERIEWSPASLSEMARARAAVALGRTVSPEELWSNIFPDQVSGLPTVEYLVSRTLLRPRDMIQILNLCCETAHRHGRSSISAEDVIEAELRFSRWKLQDLSNEYIVNYPFLGSTFAVFQNAGYVVLRGGLHKRFERLGSVLRERYPSYAHVLEPDALIDVLFSVGFVGVRRGREAVYSYDLQGVLEPHENEFVIHPCFRAALNSTAPVDLNDYAPFLRSRRILQGRDILGTLVGTQRGRLVSSGYQLIDQVKRSCARILAVIPSAGLPTEMRDEVTGQLQAMVNDVLATTLPANSVDPFTTVVHVAQALEMLATQLSDQGVNDRPAAMRLVSLIRSESQDLRAASLGRDEGDFLRLERQGRGEVAEQLEFLLEQAQRGHLDYATEDVRGIIASLAHQVEIRGTPPSVPPIQKEGDLEKEEEDWQKPGDHTEHDQS